VTFVHILIGIVLPCAIGWQLLTIVQWKDRILTPIEQGALACIAGSTGTMFVFFVLHVTTGMPLTLMWMLGTIVCLFIALTVVHVFIGRKGMQRTDVNPAGKEIPWPRWMSSVLMVYGSWVVLRIVAFSALLLVTPTFFDDSIDNWNLRAKVFFTEHRMVLQFPWESQISGISSYPPSVPLMKAWMAAVHGVWSEAVINAVHIVWFAALVTLVFTILRRRLTLHWSLLGTTIFASLPAVMLHGLNAYADSYLSMHSTAVVAMLLLSLRFKDGRDVASSLRIAGVFLALLPFTKNEGWALYFPILLTLTGLTMVVLTRRGCISRRSLLLTMGIIVLAGAMVSIPWITFKFLHGLSFGNAKGIDTNLQWQPGVLQALFVTTFLEGNWNLLAFIAPVIWIVYRSRLWSWEHLMLLLAFVIPYAVQNIAFLFTGLGAEALYQTGTVRGVVHILPILVVGLVLLTVERKNRVSHPV
jgi:hypothetical protein